MPIFPHFAWGGSLGLIFALLTNEKVYLIGSVSLVIKEIPSEIALGLYTELTYISYASSFVDCLLMPFAHFPIRVFLIFLFERALYILKILFFQLLCLFFHLSFNCLFFFFFSVPKIYVLCIKAVNF